MALLLHRYAVPDSFTAEALARGFEQRTGIRLRLRMHGAGFDLSSLSLADAVTLELRAGVLSCEWSSSGSSYFSRALDASIAEQGGVRVDLQTGARLPAQPVSAAPSHLPLVLRATLEWSRAGLHSLFAVLLFVLVLASLPAQLVLAMVRRRWQPPR